MVVIPPQHHLFTNNFISMVSLWLHCYWPPQLMIEALNSLILMPKLTSLLFWFKGKPLIFINHQLFNWWLKSSCSIVRSLNDFIANDNKILLQDQLPFNFNPTLYLKFLHSTFFCQSSQPRVFKNLTNDFSPVTNLHTQYDTTPISLLRY